MLLIPNRGIKIFLIKSNSLNKLSKIKSDILFLLLFSKLLHGKIFFISSLSIRFNLNPKNI